MFPISREVSCVDRKAFKKNTLKFWVVLPIYLWKERKQDRAEYFWYEYISPRLDCLHIYMWAKKKAAKLTVSVIKRGPISECFKGSLLKVSHGYHLNVPVFMALSSTLS